MKTECADSEVGKQSFISPKTTFPLPSLFTPTPTKHIKTPIAAPQDSPMYLNPLLSDQNGFLRLKGISSGAGRVGKHAMS
ncbi:hypothetical protein K435DRAFT_373162 [Dendrothele bispora CBS 962.96]|uniref:Uncharacterized protein n=1 Tax=Dendrothele bispora (strain CBS 962.96) TaxID=1314807 RepID=A0A4S8MH42_DENBC|nr:hypothetical protein K435DRAFT_373162 [Dendrothele bispora CBS 962.96]